MLDVEWVLCSIYGLPAGLRFIFCLGQKFVFSNLSTMNTHEGYSSKGFLSEEIQKSIATIRAENTAWFSLAEDTNMVLMRVAATAVENPIAQGINWSKEAVAVRLLMRSTNFLQGVVLMAERGMAVQARTLVRSIIEDSLVAGALTTQPEVVIKMLQDGAEASRRSQAGFIVAQGLGNSPEDRKRLKEIADKIDNKLNFLKFRKVASLSSMLPQYLNYMRLSQDSAHPSASSLHKHIQPHEDLAGWSYKVGPAQQGEIESTLHRAILAVLPVGIVVTLLIPDPSNNVALEELGVRFQALPAGTTI